MLPIQSSRDQNALKSRRTNWVLAKINQHMHLYGYELIDLPIIDAADLFLVKAGDQIIISLFTFERHGKQLALRPEFTASAADYFAKTDGNNVARWQFSGPIFEDKSHEFSAEFEQLGIGAELIGLGGSLAEAEIIAMSANGLDKLGVRNIRITIGHIGLIREIIRPFGLDARTQRFLLHQIPAFKDPHKGAKWVLEQFDNQFSSVRDRTAQNNDLSANLTVPVSGSSSTMGGRTQEDILLRMKMKQQRYSDRNNVVNAIALLEQWCEVSGEPLSTFAHLAELATGNEAAIQLLQDWQNVVLLLEAHGIDVTKITIKPDLARSWEYYTGIVFELHNGDIHIGGGGRYDELARLVGSEIDTPSVGFAYYGNQLMDALTEIPFEDEPTIIITANENNMVSAVTWANTLRSYDISVQIIPVSASSASKRPVINVESLSSAEFQAKTYPIENIDLLIHDLKQTYK